MVVERGVQKIEREIAVGRNVHDCFGDGGEAQIAGDGFAIEREAASRPALRCRAASR